MWARQGRVRLTFPARPCGTVKPVHWRAITRLFGILLLLYSLSFVPSIGVALLYDDQQRSEERRVGKEC